MWWIIYISGFIVTYLMCKWLRSKDNDNTWGDVGATIFASIFSWGAMIFMVLALVVIVLSETIKVKNPPKWL
jgi:phosphotransferase system  glucose/maltose/N-acetylglucosamine-specific IIC component